MNAGDHEKSLLRASSFTSYLRVPRSPRLRCVLPSNRLSVFPVIRAGSIDAVDGQIVARGARVEDGLRQAWIAREENPLIAADRAAADAADIVALALERRADEVEQRRLERERVRVLVVG